MKPAAESWIERYHQDSLESGARIREGLSKAVESAIRDFANGFLKHPENTALREAVAGNGSSPQPTTTKTFCVSSIACSSSWSSKSAISSFRPPSRKRGAISTATTTASTACACSQSTVTLPIIAVMISGCPCSPPSGSSKPTDPAKNWASPRWLGDLFGDQAIPPPGRMHSRQ